MSFSLVIRSLKVFVLLISTSFAGACDMKGMKNLQSGNKDAGQHWASKADHFTLPFDWHDGHIILKMQVNAQKDLRFALDTGASVTVLFETERSTDMPLAVAMQMPMQGRTVHMINDVSLTLGAITLSDMTIIQVPLDQSPLFGGMDEAYFDGAIGYDLFNRYTININYAAQTVSFYKRSTTPKLDSQWTQVKAELAGRIPYVSGLVNETPAASGSASKPYKFVVDTGAPDALYVNSKLADTLAFPTAYYTSETQNFEGKHQIKTARLGSFTLAGVTFDDIATHDVSHFKDEVGVGMIGSGLLRQFEVMFDYKNNIIALKKNKDFTAKTSLDRSGLQLEPHKKGALVKAVALDTPAKELGIKAGDVITRIDGEKVDQASFDRLRDLLSSQRSTLEICWAKAGGTACKTLTLKNRL